MTTTGSRLTVSCIIALSIGASLVIANPFHASLRRPIGMEVEDQSPADLSKDLSIKVTRFFMPDDQNRFAIVYVVLDPKLFNRRAMSAVAAQLNRDFSAQKKLKAALFDNDLTPELMVKGGIQLSDFYKAQRGAYYLDRTKCREYITFLTKSGRPTSEVRVNFKCRDLKQKPRRGLT